ncbi:MAG: peptidase M41 [Methylophagaceae bacterium]
MTTSKTTLKLDRELLKQRGLVLEKASKELKSHFIGIDKTIDELIDAMRVWHLMPEALTRPVIINLWGMTGVGKTDLVRRLIVALEMQDRFVEVELSNGDETKWFSSVGSILSRNSLNDSAAKIVLFDEIQRFNTLDSDGKPLTNTKFSDFWELLSDGRLSRRDRDDLDFLLAEIMRAEREFKAQLKKGDIDVIPPLGLYEAQQIKNSIGMDEELHQITEMPRSKIIRKLENARVSKKIYEPIDHSKTLIIISGNLDEAFSMATRTAEADIDADIFSAFTEKVSIVDVKEALSKRFKPEQVARYGNIHLIYRSLRQADFVELIQREINRIASNANTLFGIKVTVSKAIEDIIYRNGVFPVQGVRPVFSSISDILESNLSRYILEEMMAGGQSIAIDYNDDKKCLTAQLSSGQLIETPFVGRLDRARQSNLEDVVTNISTHEAGHAVAYAVLFGLAPLQLVSRVASTSAAGFTFPHEIHGTKQNILSKIKVFLSGGIAEEIVFGENNASTGRLSDREQATSLALDFIRRYGFDDEFFANYTLNDEYAMDKSATDTDVEKMMARLEGETRELLLSWKPLLLDLSEALRLSGKVDGESVAKVAKTHGLDVLVQAEGHLHVPNYASQLRRERES